jgi:type IV secretory pathway VirD2 relaxase
MNERTNERTFAWLPRPVRRELAAIARQERMTVRDLLIVAARELAAAYRHVEQKARPAPDEFETLWAPRRDAPSLIGWRESRQR